MQEKFLVEDIQPGLLDKTSMSDVFVNNSFPEKYLEVAHFSDTSNIKLPTIQNLVGTVEGNLTTNEKPDFYTNVFKKVDDNLKLKDPTYKNPIYSIDTINPENVLPYVKQDTNYSSNISAAFGQGGKGLVVGAALGAGTGAVATPEFAGLGAIPGSVIGGTIGGVSGFLSGLLNTSGKQEFIIGSNNRQRTAEEQSGFWNRVGGFTNNVIDRSFEAGLGGTAALLSTPFGALAGKDMYDWGDNPLTARLSKGLEESEYKAKLSDNYLSKGPIAKLFTGEGFQNEMADMVGFTVGMMVGTKGLGLLNKGAGILTAPAVEALGFEQKALSMASGEGMLGQVLPTLAKQSSSYFTRGTRLATEGAAAYDEALMFKGWRKGISNTYDAFKTEGVAGGLSNVGKGFTQFPTKFVNFFKDGTNSLNALSAFERTALASYGEARVESAQSYKDIYETALKLGYTGNEAANMATEGANRTLGFNMLLLGMTNQFGLNNIFKSRNVLPDLAKWLTKDYAFDNSTKLFLKNTLKSVSKNMGKGFVIEGFAEELGQFAIGEGSKNYTLDTNNPVYKSFLKEIVNAYTEGITSDEGTSNWFGGGLFGAITGMIGLDGGLLGSFRERKDAKNFEVPLSIRTKMTETNEAIMDIMRHTSAFNGQLYNSYSRDEQGNLVKNNQGNERLVKSPSTVIQLAKALESISTLTKDQVASIVDATSLDELVKNATPQEKKSLENGFNGITAYLDHIDSIKESTDGVAQGFIEFVDKLNTTQRNDVMQTLYALKTSSLTEKAKSAQDIMKQQLLSNYVYDHVSNGVESKLFDELTLLEKTIQDPNANIQDLEFLGKKYQQEEKEQALADIKQQRKDINRQVNIYRNLQLRFGQPLSYEYLRDKEGNIEKHAVTVPLKEVFRSAVRQIQIQESLKESKNTLDKELQKIVSVFGENEVLRQLNKGLSGSLENDILAEEILKNANVDYQTKVTLERIKENEDFLNFNLKYENAIFSKLTDAKSIIKNIHNRFKTLQNAIDEKEKIKEEEERLTALKKEEAERKAKAELEEAERKAKEQAEFEEKQRKDKERGVKEAQLKKEREEREAKLKKDQEEKEAQLKKQQEAEDLKKKKKEKERIVNELNRLIPDGLNIKVIGIDDLNVLTLKTKDGVITNSTIEEFEASLKQQQPVTTTFDIEAKKADIERRRQEELVANNVENVNEYIDAEKAKDISKKIATLRQPDGTILPKDMAEFKRLVQEGKDNMFIISQYSEAEVRTRREIDAKYDAELALLEQQPTSTPKLTKEELKKSNPEFFNKDGNISIADMSNDTFIKFMSGVIFDIKIDEIESNNSPYTVIQSLVDSLGLNMGGASTLLLAASEETKNYLKEIYNFYQNSRDGENYWRSKIEEDFKKAGIQKEIDWINRAVTRNNITTFKKIDSLSLDEYLKIKLGFSFLHQYPNEQRFYTDFKFNPETNQTLFRMPSKQVLDDFKEIYKIFTSRNVLKYSEINEKFLKLENFKNLSEEELIDLYNTKNLTLDKYIVDAELEALEQQTSINLVSVSSKEGIEILRNFDSKINNYRILTEYNEELDRALGLLNKRSIADKNKIANEFNTGVVFKNSDLRDDESYSKKFELVEKIIQDTIRKKYEPLFEKSSVDFFTVGKKNSNISVENITDFESVSISLLLSKNDITNVKLIEIVSPYKGIIEFSLKEGETTTAPVIFKKPHEQKEFIKTINNTINKNNLSIKGLSSEIAWQKAVARKYSQDGRLKTANKLQEELDSKIEAIGKIRNNLVSQFYDALGIVPDSSLNSNLVEFKDKPKELTALGEGGLSDEESEIPTYENFVKDDNSLPLLTLENLRRTPGFDNRDKGKTEQELENEIASLRAKEQEEIKETIPDIDDFKINGVVNEDFLSKENLVKYKKIYDKYNKIILPLITDLNILKANLHSKAMRAFYELTQTADKDDFEFVAKRAGNIDVTKELYKVWTSQGYLPKPDDVVLLLVDKKTKQPVRFNGSLAYNFLPTHSQFYNSDGSIKNDEDLITALLQPKSSSYYAFRFDSILVDKNKPIEEVREAIRLNYLTTLKEGLKERDNFIKLIKEAKDGVLVVPIEEYKEGIRPKLQGGSNTAMLGSLVDKNDKDLEIERPTKDTKGITRVFYKGEEVIVHRNALDSKDIKYLSELIYDYIKDEIPTNLSESEIEELEKKKKDKKAEIEKLVYFQSIKRNMNSAELSNNAISIDGKTLYRGPLNNIVIDTQSKPEALEQIKNLLSGNGLRAIAYHVNRQLLSSNQAIQISGVEYSSYEDFLKTKVLRVNYDYRINAIYARQAILTYPETTNSVNTISSNASGEITITKKDIENELAKFKKPTATEDSHINDVKNNIDLIIEYLKATPEEESNPKFAKTAERPSVQLFVFRYLQLTDNRYDKELAPFKQNFAQAVKEFKESVTILREDTTEPSPVITTEEKVTKKDKTEKTEATVDPEDKAKKLKAESLAKRKSKGRGAKRAITRSESDSYIRENIEEFRTWLQEVLPQFPVETTKDVIDGIAEGMFYKNVITLWELAEVGTGFHEAFEGVWNTLLTKEQKNELLNEFKQREGSFKYPFSSEILNYSQATDSQIKETIAEEFRQFMLDRKLLNKQPIKNNFFLRLWNYIKGFINSLTNKEIREISKIENLFNEISKGKFKYHNTLSVYSEKEYRLIKEDETYDMSNTVLQTIKSKVFEIFSNTNEDVLLLNKENKDLYNAKLEQIRQELLNYETASAHAEEIKDLYLSEEGFKNYVIPHLSQHLASFKIQVESVEQDENNRDKEGFVESMFIDSKNLVTGSIKTMVHTLIDREYDSTSEQYINRYSIYDYFGDINTFVDGHKVINILQNVLANTPSRVIKDGVSLDAIDLFKIKLESFKNKDGIYPRGYEWIPEFLERVQKNDDLKLAVEKSFVTTKVENSKLYLKNNEIIDLDPIQDETITNQKYKYLDYFKAKYNVDNEIETKVGLPNISGKRQNDTFNNLLDFLGIPKDEFNRAKEINPNLYGEYQVNMIDGYLKLKEEKGEALVSVQDIDNFYNTFKGISSTFKNLLLLNQDQNDRQLVYQNADGKKQYSIMNNTTWSTLINVLNLVNTKQDLLDTLPHLANKEGTDFKESLQNSKILNGLFYSRSSEEDKQSNVTYNKGDKKPQGIIDNLKYTLINGVDVDGNEGMVTASLNDVDRVIQQVYYANKGIFYTMVNSDKSSELAINIGQFFGNHENKTEGEFAEYLWNNYAENQLKFYNTYLSDETNTNYDHFSKALKSGNLFWGKVVMTDGLIDIEASKEKVLENLRVSLSGFLKDFRDNANETDLYGIVQSSNGNLAKKIVYNTLLSTIEQHLIIYGDTLFYKLKDGILDSPKRTSAYNATKEAILQSQTHWNALYNKTMRLVPKENNGKFNVESFDDIEVMIQPEKLNAMVYDAYLSIKESHNQDLTEDQIALMLGVDFKFEDGKFVVTNYKTEGYVKAYLEMNEADAQAYILTDFYMDLMYRSSKLNQEQVDSLNWKKAKEIEIRSNLDKENPLYKEYSVMHRYWAKNILENMPNNNEAVIGVLKPQYSGYSENDTLLVPALLKNSVMPLHFIDLYDEKTNTVRYTKAMKAYINAQNNGTDIIGHKSGQKFGSPVDENGKFVPMFKEGEYNDESPIQQTMYESFMGIQSEIPAKRKFEILGGSQIRKIITQNLQALADSGNHPELVQLLQEYNEIVEARYNIGLKELEKKLGLTYVNNKYVIENPSKLVDQLKDELNRLNLPDNVKEIIDLNRDRTNLLYKLEGSPNNLSLQSVLLSIVDKTLVHQKVRGKGSPQIASSLFTNDTRSTEKVTINGKEREVMTDSGLGFYYNAEGEAIGMEVLIPNPFYDIYPDLTWEQFEVMMEKDPRLKELAAYRIPTQSLGQFEFIKIKGFYDNSLGDAVIVPSGIVAKAGSDFDIDKLNIYIPHVRLTEDNQLEYIEYLDDSNSTIEERYRKYALARVYEEYSNTINEWFNSIKQSNNELNETYSNLQDVKKENSLTNETFNTLPDIYKKAFWNRNAELNEFNIKGVAKIVDFRNLADRYIELLKDKKDSKSLAIKDKLSTMIVEYDRYLNIDKSIYENFNRIRESYIEEKESFMENKDFVLTSTMLDKGYISKEEFSQLPIPEQNTKKAIENRNIELMNKLATYKTNAFTAMSANNADTLKKLSELYKEKRTDTYLSIGSFMRQVNFRQANLSSKSLVGLAAVHVTGHMITQNGNTQLTGYFINSMGNKEELNIMLSMSYDNFLSLDKVWDTQGNLITSNLSEFLSAIVDAAKDPFIFDLNINAETLNTALYLTRLGVSLADTMRFMSSPIIKQYLKKKRINTSLFKKQINEISKGQALVLVETLNGTTYGNFKNMFGINNLTKLGKLLKDRYIYGDMFFKMGPFGIVYNMDTGLPVIDYNDYEQKLQYVYDSVLEYIGKDNIQNIDPYTNDDLTKTFVLLSYLKYNQQAGYLGNINAATSIDTKAPNTVSISVDLQMKRDSIKKDGFVYNTEDMFTNTFLDTLWKNKEVGLQALSNYQIMADPLFQENYLKPALTVLNRDKYLSTAKKDQIINKFQNFLMTYFLQNYNFENGSINNRKDAIKRDVINNYNEVLKLGEEFKIYKLITKNKVKGNEFENIVKLRSNVNTSDINEAVEELLEYQELFKDSEDQEDRYNAQLVNDFLISLTEYSLLQTGFGPSRISFASYLPLQTYTKYLNEAFEDLYNNLSDKVENNNIVQLWKLFIQNNATDTLLADQIVDKENGDLGKNYFYSSGKLSKSFNTFDNYPLFVHRTYFDYDGRENKVLYQIASILEADNKLFIQYTPLDILGRGRYFTETVQKELTLKDNLLINIINSNKLEEVSIFESEMTETNSFGLNSSIKRLLVPIKTLITDFEPNVQKLFAEPTIELYNEVVGNYEYDLSTEGLTDSLIKDIETKLQDVKNSFEIINENNIVDTQIYSQLGSKTQSENIVFSNIKTNEGKYNRNANIKEAENNNRIYSMETSSDLSFSNPWAHFNRTGTIKTNTTVEAVKNYIDWLTTDKFNNVKPERKEWILNQLKLGELKNKPIQYYAELNEASHATALDYLINQYNWSTPVTTTEVSSNIEINIYASTKENAELSNFAERPFTLKDSDISFAMGDNFKRNFYSVEQAFQYIKSIVAGDPFKGSSEVTEKIASETNGAKLKALGDKKSLTTFKEGLKEWDDMSETIMYELLLASFKQNPQALNQLLATGNATLTHKYKGAEQDNGRFSKLLMEVRQELKPTIVDNTTIVANTQETQITYTPKGKATQTYTVRGSKIFNKAGKEVFTKDSIDRNKVFANVAVQQGRAVIVNYQDADYVVNTRNQIISVTTGKQMQWAENNGDRKNVLSLALNKFNALNSTTKIPRNTVEGTKNECLK